MKKFLIFDFNIPGIIDGTKSGGGGASIQVCNWILGLLKTGQKVGIIVDENTNIINGKREIEIVRSFDLKKGIPIINWLYYRYPRLKQSIKKNNPDYILQAGAGFITWILSYISKKNNIVFIHRIANDVDTDERIKKRLNLATRLFYYQGLTNSKVIICQNKYQYHNLKRIFPDKNLKILYNPFYNYELPKSIKLFNNRKYIAWLGLFQYQKNLPGLLNVVKKMPEMMFKIGGIPQSNIDKKTEMALIELRKCSNVVFLGYIKRAEINGFLGNAYALLNTSHYEGFSNTFLESFAAGTPVITTSKVDPDNIIATNGLGYVSYDFSAIPDLINRLININKDDYYEMCVRCRHHVEKNHDPMKLASELLKFIGSSL